MKKELFHVRRLSLGAILAIFLATGCVSHRAYTPVVATTPTGEVVVTEAPPAPRTEVVPVAPSSADVWVGGYWLNRQGGVAWIPGHWDRTSAGWVWTPGRWQ